MASTLLALIDDIATLLDDVAVMSKVAAKKTAGVLGDDLALNAQQVAGVAAERELPVVWAVARGSFLNKLILVPAALLISAWAPWLVMPLLMLGGAYLCFEGAEKIAHKWLHASSAEAVTEAAAHAQHLAALADPSIDIAALEADKIRGAIRTDFILSAEIIVIALGTLAAAPMPQRITALAVVAVAMTVGVYGLVAAIVKLDDLGAYLTRRAATRALGTLLLQAAPVLMKTLSVAGTVAMFLVGGSILLHGLPGAEHWVSTQLGALPGASLVAEGVAGLVCGALLVAGLEIVRRVRGSGGC